MLLRSLILAAVFAHGSPIDEVYLSTKIWTRLKEVGMTDGVVRRSNPVLPDFVAIWIVSDRAYLSAIRSISNPRICASTAGSSSPTFR